MRIKYRLFCPSVGIKIGFFGLLGLALCFGKNRVCLFARELPLYAVQRPVAMASAGFWKRYPVRQP